MKKLNFEDDEEAALWRNIVQELITAVDTEAAIAIADKVVKVYRKRDGR